MTTYGTSRGLRNHNPFNLRPVDLPAVWDGQVGLDEAEGGPFSIFGDYQGREADFWGIRAGCHNFYSYQVKDGCVTLGQIIARHAPPSDNNDTAAYVDFVCGGLDIPPTDPVSLMSDPGLMLRLAKLIIQEENGSMPYPDSLLNLAIAAA